VSVGVISPALKVVLGRQSVRLAAIARGVGKHKVMHQVARVLSERDEVINVRLVHLSTAVEAPVVHQLAQFDPDIRQSLSWCLKHEGLKVIETTQECEVESVAFDVLNPVGAAELVDQWLETTQAVTDAR